MTETQLTADKGWEKAGNIITLDPGESVIVYYGNANGNTLLEIDYLIANGKLGEIVFCKKDVVK